MTNLAEPNESVKLKLSWAWEPNDSGSTLSFSEGKSSKCFVFDGDKAIHGRDEKDTSTLNLPLHGGCS